METSFHIFPEDFLEEVNPSRRLGRDRNYWTEECSYQISHCFQMSKRSFHNKYEAMIGVDYSGFCKWFKFDSEVMISREKRVYSCAFKKKLYEDFQQSSVTSLAEFLLTDPQYRSKPYFC